MEQAKRYNKGKLRYELIPQKPLQYLAEVYTKGAHKYSVYEDNNGNKILGKDIPLEEVYKYKLIEDAAQNWRKGLPWMETLGAIQRHIEAFKSGEELDPELKTRHLANASWGLFSLMEYEKTHAEFDDRDHSYLKNKKIGLDIDDVLADFVPAWCKYFKIPIPEFWTFDRNIKSKFDEVKNNKEFWMSIPVKTKPEDIPFEPTCYITARQVSKEWTEEWLDIMGFPAVPVYFVGHNMSKVEVAKEAGIDIFIDDKFENFVEMNKAGILTYLFDATHNQRYNVGYKRIYSLKDLIL